MGYSLEIKINDENKDIKEMDHYGWVDINDDGSIEIFDKDTNEWFRAEKSEDGAHWLFKQHTGLIGKERFYLTKDEDSKDCHIYTLYDRFKNKTYDVFFKMDDLEKGNVTRIGSVYPSQGADYYLKYWLYNRLAESSERQTYSEVYSKPSKLKPILKGIGKFFFWYLIVGSIYVLITDPATFFGDIKDQPVIFICFGIFMVFLFRITRKDE